MRHEDIQPLIILYKQIADHTVGECGTCPIPYSCCHPQHCKSAELYAQQQYGVDIRPKRTDNAIPFLGPNGCVVEPHLRPICSLYTCYGRPHDQQWTARYQELRDQIDELEFR